MKELRGETGRSSGSEAIEAGGRLIVYKVGAPDEVGDRAGKLGESPGRSWKFASPPVGRKVKGEKVEVAGWLASNAALKRAASESSVVPSSEAKDAVLFDRDPNSLDLVFGLGGRRNSSVVLDPPTTSRRSTRFSRNVGLLRKSTTGRSYGLSSRPMKDKVVFCDSLDVVFLHSRTTFCWAIKSPRSHIFSAK
jgi:hypothetical protein